MSSLNLKCFCGIMFNSKVYCSSQEAVIHFKWSRHNQIVLKWSGKGERIHCEHHMVHMHFFLRTKKQHRDLGSCWQVSLQTRGVDKGLFWGDKASSLLRQELESVWWHFSETRCVLIRVCVCVYVCSNITRSMCQIYLWLSRCYAVKLPSCHWLKQWTCLRMIGWNQLWHCGISQFRFLPKLSRFHHLFIICHPYGPMLVTLEKWQCALSH